MEVCRLCLDLQSDNNYSPLDGTYKDMVQVVAPELNLEISNAPIVCNECSSNLDELFIFKTRCFEHEEKLRPKCENIKNKFRLKEVLDGTTGGDGTALKKETTKDRICRACLGPIECESFTILKPSEPDAYLDSMLTMCLPELDLELTKDPVMCEACLENLQKLHHFKSTCLDIEDKLASYCESHGTNSSDQINLNSVLESELKMDEDDSDYSNIKSEQFDDESKDTSMKSENDSEMMGDAELKHEEVDIKSETDASAAGSSSDKEFENDESPEEKPKKEKPEEKLKQEEPKERPRRGRKKKSKILACPDCNYQTFKVRSSLREHLLRCHGICDDDSKIEKCPKCPYQTSMRSVLKKHISKVHEKIKPHECSFCDYKSTLMKDLKEHFFKKHGKVDKSLLKKCTKCTYETTMFRALTQHIKRVHEKNIFVECFYCGYKTQYKNCLREHLFKKHNKADQSGLKKCPKCKYTTLIPSKLKTHIRMIHERIKAHECSDCDYKSQSKREMTEHRFRKHGKGDKSLLKKCTKCTYETTLFGAFTQHIKRVHEKNEIFECFDCGYKTHCKNRLREHLFKKHRKGAQTRV